MAELKDAAEDKWKLYITTIHRNEIKAVIKLRSHALEEDMT